MQGTVELDNKGRSSYPVTMKQKTGIELQEARVAASVRFQEIGIIMMQEAGVKTWEFHKKGLCGRGSAKRKHISCPKPTTRRRLYILAHECGHVALNHANSKPSHRQEYEAEQYAHDAMRRHGVAVPRKETNAAKEYVAQRIDQAIRMGKAKRLDREAVEWCESKHHPATRAALADKAVELVNLGGKHQKTAKFEKETEDKRPMKQDTLAAILRSAARASGLSTYEIAKRTGHDQSGLNKFFNGSKDNLRIDVVDSLFRLFGLKVIKKE